MDFEPLNICPGIGFEPSNIRLFMGFEPSSIRLIMDFEPSSRCGLILTPTIMTGTSLHENMVVHTLDKVINYKHFHFQNCFPHFLIDTCCLQDQCCCSFNLWLQFQFLQKKINRDKAPPEIGENSCAYIGKLNTTCVYPVCIPRWTTRVFFPAPWNNSIIVLLLSEASKRQCRLAINHGTFSSESRTAVTPIQATNVENVETKTGGRLNIRRSAVSFDHPQSSGSAATTIHLSYGRIIGSYFSKPRANMCQLIHIAMGVSMRNGI